MIKKRALLAIIVATMGLGAPRVGLSYTQIKQPAYFPPEYHPVDKVVVSEDLFAFSRHAFELGNLIIQSGAELVVLTNEREPLFQEQSYREHFGSNFHTLPINHGVLWIRDFGPIPIIQDNEVVLNDFSFTGASTDLDDFPRRFAAKTGMKSRGLSIAIDGGNILSDGKRCFVGIPPFSSEFVSPQSIRHLVNQAASSGCLETIIVRDVPHIHIDMYVKLLPNDVAIVNELKTSRIFQWQRDLKDRLDSVARQLSDYKKVIRIPMYSDWPQHFLTYTNAILVNQLAIIPEFRTLDMPVRLQAHKVVRAAYENSGYLVHFVPADELIQSGGAFHCVSIQIPALGGVGPKALPLRSPDAGVFLKVKALQRSDF